MKNLQETFKELKGSMRIAKRVYSMSKRRLVNARIVSAAQRQGEHLLTRWHVVRMIKTESLKDLSIDLQGSQGERD